MVGGIGDTKEVSVGPAIQVSVFAADVPVTSKTRFALTAVHGVGEDAQVDAVGMLVAVVGPILARVAWYAHLRGIRVGVR